MYAPFLQNKLLIYFLTNDTIATGEQREAESGGGVGGGRVRGGAAPADSRALRRAGRGQRRLLRGIQCWRLSELRRGNQLSCYWMVVKLGCTQNSEILVLYAICML